MSINPYFVVIFTIKALQGFEKSLPLHRVFHSIRFKVNKVGVQRYSFFYALTSATVLFVARFCQQ